MCSQTWRLWRSCVLIRQLVRLESLHTQTHDDVMVADVPEVLGYSPCKLLRDRSRLFCCPQKLTLARVCSHNSLLSPLPASLSFMLQSLLVLALSAALVSGQLAGPVGPTTTYQQKAAVRVCNVLNYGAKPNGKTDFGPALYSAWQACKKGGLVYIPPGSYGLESRINLRGGTNVALQLDGTIIRRGTAGGTLLTMRGIKDFEFFSGNSKGAIQGFGFEFLKDGKYGPRFMRLQDIDGFSMHGLALVDSPSYYVVLDNVRNGEIYNMILRGITVGMTDAFDVSAVNTWIHDIEITNGDECVTIKQGSHNVLVETVYCNISGGNAVGSLGTGALLFLAAPSSL